MTIAPEERAFYERLASLSGWDIAKELGLSYCGDTDPIRHGGYFYNPAKWDEWGYAPAVEFWWDDESDRVCVSPGTINRPDDMERVFLLSGLAREHQGSTLAQIEATKNHGGFEPDEYTPTHTYDPDTWAEWRLWRSVLPMLRSIQAEV